MKRGKARKVYGLHGFIPLDARAHTPNCHGLYAQRTTIMPTKEQLSTAAHTPRPNPPPWRSAVDDDVRVVVGEHLVRVRVRVSVSVRVSVRVRGSVRGRGRVSRGR